MALTLLAVLLIQAGINLRQARARTELANVQQARYPLLKRWHHLSFKPGVTA